MAKGSDRARELERLQRKIQELMSDASDLPDVRSALAQALLAANEAWSEEMREDDEGGPGDGRGIYERSKLSDSRPLNSKNAPGAHKAYS